MCLYIATPHSAPRCSVAPLSLGFGDLSKTQRALRASSALPERARRTVSLTDTSL